MPNPTFREFNDQSLHGSDAALLNSHEAAFHTDAFRPPGVTIQNFPLILETSVAQAITDATMYVSTISLPSNMLVTNLYITCGSTGMIEAGVTPHLWLALYDANLKLLGQSADDV